MLISLFFCSRGRSSCSSCKTVLAFLLIGACLVICAGLIWLHFDMKNSIQILQEQIHSGKCIEAKKSLNKYRDENILQGK